MCACSDKKRLGVSQLIDSVIVEAMEERAVGEKNGKGLGTCYYSAAGCLMLPRVRHIATDCEASSLSHVYSDTTQFNSTQLDVELS